MKKLCCEMCGSSSLIKQDSFLVCEHCGMKYSLEEEQDPIFSEADTTDPFVSDNSALVQKDLANARLAYNQEDWEETEKYYNLVKRNAPNNIEAIFFSSFGKAMLSLSSSDYTRRDQIFNTLKNSIPIVIEGYNNCHKNKGNVPETEMASLRKITNALVKMNTVKYVYSETANVGELGSRAWQEQLFFEVQQTFITRIEKIEPYDAFEKLARRIRMSVLYFLGSYLQKGREACKQNDWPTARTYYSIVSVYDRYNIESLFFVPFSELMIVAVKDPDYRNIEKTLNVLKEKITLVHRYYDELSEERENALKFIVDTIAQMNKYLNSNSSDTKLNGGYSGWKIIVFGEVKKAFLAEIKEILKTDHEDYIKDLKNTMSKFTYGHCYIATAVYGSYDCPQVWTLRRFRDQTLASVWYGRIFIKVYYALSPILVKYCGHTSSFRHICKGALDRMVKELNSRGFHNTPYNDIFWG
ncbi:MAG: CFI-box-CTERM domain-containing protein [Candidatus Bruticola sp.]